MKKIIPTLVILIVTFTFAFSSPISLKDIYVSWFEPSDLNTWTSPWMLPVLYEEATNTAVVNGYYRNESGGTNSLNLFGVYAFDRFIGGDYMSATVKATYTTFKINRYTIGLAVPNAGFDIRYINAMDGNLQYYDEVGMDVEFIYNWNNFWPWFVFSPKNDNSISGSKIFSYIKIFNFVRFIKPAYPLNSPWQSVYGLDYLIRTVWTLPQFTLIYDNYNGIDEISYQLESYNALELLIKAMDNVILRGGINFENLGQTSTPSVNLGANITFKNFNINVDYQRVLAESIGTFAVSGGMSF